jgi:ABC-2 type transport system permease protein/capsular polysaccharide transport system permease protein
MMDRIKLFNPLAFLTVVVPTIIAVLYYGLFAQDIYISESRIIVRSPEQSAPSPLNVALGQTGFGQANEGNNTVIAYLQSRQAIEEGNSDGFITDAYNGDDVFWFDRFGWFGGTSKEEFYRYFSDQIDVEEGASTQVLTITVRAFDPEEARTINRRLVEQSETLVNSLSGRSQSDQIEIAESEVEEAAEAARLASLELAQFRDTSGIVDPAQQSEVGLQMISKLQDELIGAQTRLRQLQTYTPQASQIPFLQTQVRELQSQIARARSELTGGRASLASAMAQ